MSTKFARVSDITLCYEEQGQGEPLILVPGLGCGRWLWFRQLPSCAQMFRVIALDNRGSGRSDKPPGPYTIAQMADDVKGLLEALNIEKAHVLGISLGGFIAQEFALRYPQHLGKLILVSTSLGGQNLVLPDAEVLQFFAQIGTGSPEENLEQGLQFVFTPECLAKRPKEIEELRNWMRKERVPQAAYLAQLMAATGFDAETRASQIQAPTLIVAGARDRVVPAENARRLAAVIPSAKLIMLSDCGHLCPVERAEAFNQAVLEFLQE